jgi:uncharacterized protein (UPF0335 family)
LTVEEGSYRMDQATTAAIVEQSLLQVAQNMEEQLDAQIHQLENLDEDDLERIRRKRLEEFRRHEKNREQWLARGHGTMSTIIEKDFFKEIKGGAYADVLRLRVADKEEEEEEEDCLSSYLYPPLSLSRSDDLMIHYDSQ